MEHPHDEDARITKMRDGRQHPAHKPKHAVDLYSTRSLAMTVRPVSGDSQSLWAHAHGSEQQVQRRGPAVRKAPTGTKVYRTTSTGRLKPLRRDCSLQSGILHGPETIGSCADSTLPMHEVVRSDRNETLTQICDPHLPGERRNRDGCPRSSSHSRSVCSTVRAPTSTNANPHAEAQQAVSPLHYP